MARIYVGNLPLDMKSRDIDDLFYKYGRIVDIDLKSPSRPPAFAFVDFDDYRAAEDAVRGRGTRRILQLHPKLLRLLPRPTHAAHRTDADLADGAWQTA